MMDEHVYFQRARDRLKSAANAPTLGEPALFATGSTGEDDTSSHGDNRMSYIPRNVNAPTDVYRNSTIRHRVDGPIRIEINPATFPSGLLRWGRT
jgi:hypothetical protein